MQHIAIFASGSGTNAQKIIEHFQKHSSIKVSLVVCNRTDAGVLGIAKTFGVPDVVVSKAQLNDEMWMLALLKQHRIDFIALAGFLLLVPGFLVKRFHKRIVNIHPALLPKYGGKGMYGKHVHQAVFDNNENESGITIHYASEHYDEGDIIIQKKVALANNETSETIAQKVQRLEHEWYPKVIEETITNPTH